MIFSLIKRILLGLVTAGAIGYISWLAYTGRGKPMFDFLRTLPGGDKLGHIVLMFLASVAMSAVFCFKGFKIGCWRIYIGALLVLVVISIDEYCQQFSFWRSFDWLDIACNVVGVTAAIVTVNIYKKSISAQKVRK